MQLNQQLMLEIQIITENNMKLKKGSAAAKAFMAQIRAKKATTKKVAAKKTMSKHTDTKSHNVNIRVVSGTKKPVKKRFSKFEKEYNKDVDNYKYFVVSNGVVKSGWEYKSDANDDLENYENSKVYTKITLKKLGIKNPSNDWKYKLGDVIVTYPSKKEAEYKIERNSKGMFKGQTRVYGIKKNNKMGELSAYKIYWNVLMPIKGKLTKTDQVKINKFLGEKGVATKIYPYNFTDGILYSFGTKIDQNVNKILLNNPLKKSLISYKFTDKQFGLANPLKGDIKFGYKNYIVLTEKQKQEAIFIK